MLVLTRKRFEKIQIGENIVIKVIKTGKSAVKIGIEAPQDVRVVRAELCEPDDLKRRNPKLSLAGSDENRVVLPCPGEFPHAMPHAV